MNKLTLLEKVNDLLDAMRENYTEDCSPSLLDTYERCENLLLDFKEELMRR